MLKQRIITAILLVSVFLATLLLFPPLYFGILAAAILIAASWELGALLEWKKAVSRWALVVFHLAIFIAFALTLSGQNFLPGGSFVVWLRDILLLAIVAIWIFASCAVLRHPNSPSTWLSNHSVLVLGSMILLASVMSLVFLRFREEGHLWVIYCVAIVAAADIGAYFSGRRWGKLKLAEAVSPGKSWEGFWGGAVCVQIIAVGFYLYSDDKMMSGPHETGLFLFMLVAFILSTASVMGDLFESLLKRRVGLKDSSQLLPGHGGVLDRVDGLLAALPLLVICHIVLGW